MNISKNRFGRLVVLRRVNGANTKYECYCDCGNIKIINSSSLLSGETKSCGCFSVESSKARAIIPENKFPRILYEWVSSDDSLKVIGNRHGVTGERIRQIIAMFGVVRRIPKQLQTKEEINKKKLNKRIKEFWSKVNATDNDDECWEWEGGTHPVSGYGLYRIKFLLKSPLTHRVSWTLSNGEIPKEMWVLHDCDNPICVNPNHLYLGNAKNNADDRESRGRGNKFKLSEDDIAHIKNRKDSSLEELSNTFGVTKATIYKIQSGHYSKNSKRSHYNLHTKRDMVNDYLNGVGITEISVKYNVSLSATQSIVYGGTSYRHSSNEKINDKMKSSFVKLTNYYN